MGDDVQEKVRKYEEFLNERLKRDLQKVLAAREAVYADIADYLLLKSTIEQLKVAELPKGELRTKVDLGCNFYVQAKVPDPKKVCVAVGFGFFVECSLDEALGIIEKRVALLNKKSEQLTEDSSKIKANIRVVLEGLGELQFGQGSATSNVATDA
ncbi:protein UXT homolog [Sycon ciliatum]|uniref:protein UXT homolog n=1 Tax=Sycon ciliatum TaxID=27933 RepID=UPI0031F5FBFF|eukprot:scpid8903/ scgid15756/ Protein UXT homolog